MDLAEEVEEEEKEEEEVGFSPEEFNIDQIHLFKTLPGRGALMNLTHPAMWPRIRRAVFKSFGRVTTVLFTSKMQVN